MLKTERATVVAVLVAIACTALLGALLATAGYVWWLKRQAAKVPALERAAQTAQGNADSANAGAANASATRHAVDTLTVDLRVTAEESARRIEHATPGADAGQPADADVLRELEAAGADYRAAAYRLQRARPR